MYKNHFTQNNLADSSSPYLRQHKNNPIWWQEWNKETLDYAKKENKIIFSSVGYATCHWCHVMASEAFSDNAIAEYLNEYFVSIKVDREQRPDIDQHLMAFVVSLSGQGGWPLNAFLTPDGRPIYALTYAPITPRYRIPGFLDILKKVKEFYDINSTEIEIFTPSKIELPESSEDKLILNLTQLFDNQYGGFDSRQKFPAHSTLLFMLYYASAVHNEKLLDLLTLTLDSMAMGGLHDHLQGGFFRYCVDRKWTIPHFEKMLYDQTLLLWVYALAFKLFAKPEYKKISEKIIRCLRQTFEFEGLFYSGCNADTEYEEGKTYLWSIDELQRILSSQEYDAFSGIYEISKEGNFEGKNHFLKRKNIFLDAIEEKLLLERKKRPQPEVDKKIITSWNCLTALGLIQAYRYIGNPDYLISSQRIYEKLMTLHFDKGTLFHSSYQGIIQKQEFLQDYAAMLLLLTYLEEDIGGYREQINFFSEKIKIFKKDGGNWIESNNSDFIEAPADVTDQPVPSSVSLVTLALLRRDLFLGKEYFPDKFKPPQISDFYNISVLIQNGLFRIISTPDKLDWSMLPINTIQVKGNELKTCYKGVCMNGVQK